MAALPLTAMPDHNGGRNSHFSNGSQNGNGGQNGGAHASRPSGRPSGNHNSGAGRPGSNGNHGGSHNGSGNRPGGNGGNRPGTGNGNHRPGGSGNNGSHRPGGNTGGNHRPGTGNGNHRPGDGGHTWRPGQGGNHGGFHRPGDNGNHNGWRPTGGHNHGRPTPVPPHRHPAGHRHHVPFFGHYHRPLPPPSWRPVVYGPSFGTILGIALGTTVDLTLRSLLNQGYTVTSYGNNVVYLSNVPQMNYYWPDAALYYNNGALCGSTFTYPTAYYDMSRYNALYNTFCSQYGVPVSSVNQGGVISSTWFGNGNRYVTLEFNSTYGNYYTTLSFGL